MVKNMSLRKKIIKNCRVILLLLVLILPMALILLTIETPIKKVEINTEQRDLVSVDKILPKSSNSETFAANDFELKTEWIKSLSTTLKSNLPYKEIKKSLIADFNGDGNKDIIFTDGNELWAYDKNESLIFQRNLVNWFGTFVDIAVGNLSDSKGADIVVLLNKAFYILSYPGADIATVGGNFSAIKVQNISPNSPYDEIIVTNYSARGIPSTVIAYNATGDILWTFKDTVYNKDQSLYYLETGYDLDGDGKDDDIAAFSSNDNPFRNATIFAINETGKVIYSWAIDYNTTFSFTDAALGNFETSVPGDEICFIFSNFPVTIMVSKPSSPNDNATWEWYNVTTHYYDVLIAGENLIENSGSRDDLLFGYQSGDNFIIEIRNGSDYTKLNWSRTILNAKGVIASVFDLDNNNRDEVLIGDNLGYIYVYEAPGSFKWESFFGSAISIMYAEDLLSPSNNKEIIIHPLGHIAVILDNGTKVFDIGNSEIEQTQLMNLDSDDLLEIIAILKDNRIIAVDNDGTLLWSYLSDSPVNTIAPIDQNNDKIEDYLYVLSSNFGAEDDYILAINGNNPVLKYSNLLTGFAVSIGDFDRDGIDDEIITGGYSLKVQTLTNFGLQTLWEQTFRYGPLYTNSILNIIIEITIGDFNGNGYDDVGCTFFSFNQTNPLNSPTNTSTAAYDGFTGNKIFQYNNLNYPWGSITSDDLNSDGTDELILGFQTGNVSVIKRSGSSGSLLWSKQFQSTVLNLKTGQFTNDSFVDVAVLTRPLYTVGQQDIRVINGSNGEILRQYSVLNNVSSQTNLVSGNINNENRDLELITGSRDSGYSAVNVFTQNYSIFSIPQNLNKTYYPSYLEGEISYIEAGNVTGGITDNIIGATTKGVLFCLSAFQTKSMEVFELEVSLENKTFFAGEYMDVYFEVERNKPDIVQRIEINLVEWKTGITVETYITEESIRDLRIEPGITKITAKMLIPVSCKGKYYISGNFHLDNLTSYDIIGNGFSEPFVTSSFDVLGKNSYTFVKSVEILDRFMDFSNFIDLNITIRNSQSSSETINLTIYACLDNIVINQTLESVVISGNSETMLERSIFMPFEEIPNSLTIFGLIKVLIAGRQGSDSKSKLMSLTGTNGDRFGYYYNSVNIFNSTNQKVVQLSPSNITSYILKIDRSAATVIENYTMQLSFYNDYNFNIILGGMFLTNDFDENATLFSNDTGEPGINEDFGGNAIYHPAKSSMNFNLNISFAQTKEEGVHSMFLFILAINMYTLRLEYSGFQLLYNLTGELENSLYFEPDTYISNAIVQSGTNITVAGELIFTSVPAVGANLTTLIQLEEIGNESNYFNQTRVYNIAGKSSLLVNMSINTGRFNNTLVSLELAVLDDNFTGIIVPWNRYAAYAVIEIVGTERYGFYQANTHTNVKYTLNNGNVTVIANFTKSVKLGVNSLDPYSNPAPDFITDSVSDQLDVVGFWMITSNTTLIESNYAEHMSITIYYVPGSAFAQRVHERDLIPYYYNASTRTWTFLSDFTLSESQNSMTFTLTHLSIFAIGGLKEVSTPLIQITTTFAGGKTYDPLITINWQSTFSDWSAYWTRYSLYLDNGFLNDATNNSQTIRLPSDEKLCTIKVIGYDVFNNSATDDLTVWLDLDKLSITGTSDDVNDNGDLPSTGYLKLTWQGSQDLLYYIIRVNGETVESHYTGTSYEFEFTESGSYTITILGVDSYGDQTEVTFTVSYEAPDEVNESSEEFNSSILALIIGATVTVSVIGVILLILRKDKIVDYSKAKSIKK